ncbi:YdiK family protein [Cytobacillus spongiae]|jgi:uncharacterized membrane protein HdeD (DUF308 family)|uniref:YdiK family protein n=1 Tax=Cytobacillus spongiae TaxID=2901381 RepID=UPI001F2CC158|nr:YdiK family protein [Cytobacillus spongiae]UII56234.1 YdiK family protein [Cytobacillus spongiae]
MRRSPLFSGIVYVCLGLIFTLFAVQNVRESGEYGFITYLFIMLATFDLGSGIRMIMFHFKLKKVENKK